MAFENYDREKLFKALYDELITPFSLPIGLYTETYKELLNGVDSGFGGSLLDFDFDSSDYRLLNSLYDNIYLFSGAKTFTQVLDMKGAMFEEGKLLPFNDFRKKADSIFDIYNEVYLKTEYNTSIGQAQMCSEWVDIEKNKALFPYLRYDTVDDARVSDICRPLEGITLPVGHPFWNTRSPLNHFNCRCRLIRVDKYDDPLLSTKEQVKTAITATDGTMQDIFKINPFKDELIFSKKHPYFQVPKGYKELAKKNFMLPIPKHTEK